MWKYGSSYKPTTTGLVERFNRTLGSKLKKITDFEIFDWAKCVKKAIKAYMNYYHRAKGCAPIELIRGQELNYMDEEEGIKKN